MTLLHADIIVPAFNSASVITDCLSSLLATEYPDFSITVVDDASMDDTARIVREEFPSVRLISNTTNLGAAEAKNVGIRASSGPLVATVDSDVEVTPDWLAPLADALLANDAAATCGKMLLRHADRRVLLSCGIDLCWDGEPVEAGAFELDRGQWDAPRPVMAGCSAAALYQKEAIEAVGLFDGAYRYPEEDVDLGWRINLAGQKFLYTPESVVYHHLSHTMGLETYAKIHHIEKNRIRSLLKNVHPKRKRDIFFAMMRRNARHLEVGLKRLLNPRTPSGERAKYFSAILRARFWNVRNIRETLKLRAEVNRFRQLSQDELARRLLKRVPADYFQPDYRLVDSQSITAASEKREVTVGVNEKQYLGFGWGPPLRSRQAGGRVRWMRAEADLYFPSLLSQTIELRLLVDDLATLPVILEIFANGTLIRSLELGQPGLNAVRIDLGDDISAPIQLTLADVRYPKYTCLVVPSGAWRSEAEITRDARKGSHTGLPLRPRLGLVGVRW